MYDLYIAAAAADRAAPPPLRGRRAGAGRRHRAPAARSRRGAAPRRRGCRGRAIEAVGVCLLHAYANPAHERLVRAILREALPDVAVDAVERARARRSASTSARRRRWPTSTCSAWRRALPGAAAAPARARSASPAALHHAVERRALRRPRRRGRFPVRLIESGPAAGALAAAHHGALARRTRTSSPSTWAAPPPRSCVIEDGEPLTRREFEVDRRYRFKKGSGLPIKVAGHRPDRDRRGRRLDRPHRRAAACSRSARRARAPIPGPVVLRPRRHRADRHRRRPRARLPRPRLLPRRPHAARPGGGAARDRRARRRRPLGLDPVEAAWGIHQLVNDNMAGAARVTRSSAAATSRGFPLFAFGGAGPCTPSAWPASSGRRA